MPITSNIPVTFQGTDTPVIDIQDKTLFGVYIPADITSASFSVRFAPDANTTPVATYLSGAEVTYTIPSTATGFYPLLAGYMPGYRYVSLNFGSSESAGTEIYLVTREAQ